ncbi:S41 family peptidase [Fimbriimonas ginsengisoli]|uniref:S41 family peptidase n=1 Tax=Fimbriimonas ginsengisoli TaxID=1005039 RepID=UPI001186EB31|nr:S41 family peptidase [Fimbriimonas ginsengisoli]
MKFKPFVALVQLFALSVTCASAVAQSPISNPGFETGSVGQNPPGWAVVPLVTAAGYTVQISTESPKEGKQCVCVALGARKGDGFGNLFQEIPPGPFLGKRVRFRGAVRYESGGEQGQAQLWLRVDGPDGPLFLDNMGRRPIRSSAWAFYDIVAKIPGNATNISVGMMLVGGGRAFLDATSLQLADVQEEPVEPPRALTDRGVQNLVAFAKLFGYVRHFHPSDAVEKADWNAYAMAGVKVAEGAKDPADLAQRLEAFFKPLAPTVRVFATGEKPAPVDMAAPPKAQIVTWDNLGFGGGTIPAGQNIYHSKRVFAAKAAGSPDPKSPFTADLGGGVSCQVPLALYAVDGSALPHTADPVTPKGVRAEPTGDDRTTRLADVVLDWNVYEHFYPYFDAVKVDWAPVLPEALKAAATDRDERAFLNTLRRMTAMAKDGHGFVGSAADDQFAMPPFAADWVEGKFIVTQVAPGTPKLLPGDEILEMDGTPVDNLWKGLEPLISGATDQWRRNRGKREMLVGPEGSSLEVKAKRGAGQPFTASVPRSVANQLKEKRPKAIEELKVGYWYVDLDGGRINMAEYQKSLRDLTSAQGIIFDMRGYPNEVAMDVLPRLAKEPITSALWNVPRVTKPDREGMEFVKSRWPLAQPTVPRFRGKIAFITDGRAISFAESVMGMVENYKLGEIVGEPTAGTNGNVNPFALPGGYTVVFTGMKVLKHDGTTHHGVGILPTIPVHRTIAGVAAGRDEALEKALAIVRGS